MYAQKATGKLYFPPHLWVNTYSPSCPQTAVSEIELVADKCKKHRKFMPFCTSEKIDSASRMAFVRVIRRLCVYPVRTAIQPGFSVETAVGRVAASIESTTSANAAAREASALRLRSSSRNRISMAVSEDVWHCDSRCDRRASPAMEAAPQAGVCLSKRACGRRSLVGSTIPTDSRKVGQAAGARATGARLPNRHKHPLGASSDLTPMILGHSRHKPHKGHSTLRSQTPESLIASKHARRENAFIKQLVA